MALDIELIQFFVKRISNSNSQTFGSEVAHLFEHLEKEVKNNPIYAEFESSRIRWKEWEEESDWIFRTILTPVPGILTPLKMGLVL